jgi:hypothetical protein
MQQGLKEFWGSGDELETGFQVMLGLRNVLAIWFKGNGVNSVGFQGMLSFTDLMQGVLEELRGSYGVLAMRFQGVLDFSDVYSWSACDTIFRGCRVTAFGMQRDIRTRRVTAICT